jgi:hypothetical protein
MERKPDQAPRPANAGGPAATLPLPPERRAALEPQLQALLTDFAKLEALVRPETEPALTPDLEGYVRG